jgi:3-oxoacyl-[acyl-carrier-protein] synthase-3
MAFLHFENVEIKGIAACVPPKKVFNKDLSFIPAEDLDKVINAVGIRERRVAEEEVLSSDLCFKAAEQLLEDLSVDKNEIDVLIFVSQTPDYRQPSTAPSLQYRLGLPTSTMAFDINMACSGYAYGLSVAYSFASQPHVKKVLLLVGETMSKTISLKDKNTTPLFGDAGTATVIEKSKDETASYFYMNSDGEGAPSLRVPYGGYRNPSSVEGFKEVADEEGNVRNGEQLHMNGIDVFNFGLRVVPKSIKEIVNLANDSLENVDIIHFHQANKFMTDFFAKKLKFPSEKVPYSLDKFGNTSAASIPLNIVSEMRDSFPSRKNVILAGFGAGLSWGIVKLSLENTFIAELIEY